MTEREYRQHPAISRSELWRMNESPEKFKWFKDHPPEPTPALLFGQLTHKLLLEPETFDHDFVVMPEIDRRTKDGRAAYNAFLKQYSDKSIVTIADYQKAHDMAEKARSVPIVRELLKGQKEQPFFWTDEDTGEKCKCRTDILTETESGLRIVDFKSANSAKTEIFNNDIFRFGYHFQSAFYSTGVKVNFGLSELPPFTFIVQEKTPPYSLNVIDVPDEVMLAGIDKYRELLGIYHECKTTGYWYGYNGPFDEPNEAFLPGWMNLGVEDED